MFTLDHMMIENKSVEDRIRSFKIKQMELFYGIKMIRFCFSEQQSEREEGEGGLQCKSPDEWKWKGSC